MAAERPRPGQSDGRGPGIYDHTLWMLLRAYVAHRPPLPAVIAVVDPNPERQAQRQLRVTASDLAGLADQVGDLLALPAAPDGQGGARAVGVVVERMCREFAERWSQDIPVTTSLMTGFAREVQVLEATLDAIAGRSAT